MGQGFSPWRRLLVRLAPAEDLRHEVRRVRRVRLAHRLGDDGVLGADVGDLDPQQEREVAKIPDVPLLIPGLGAQGGDMAALRGARREAPILVNVSRGILYAEPDKSFTEKAKYWAKVIAG